MKDRVAVITGATGGLGSVVAKRLAGEGARLVLTGTNAGRLERLAGELALPPDRVLTGVYNFVEPRAAGLAAEMVLEKFGQVDALLHLVGGWTGGKPVVDVPPGDLTHMLDQHVWTTFHVARAAVPHMVEAGWGRVVAVLPTTVATPGTNGAAYTAAKAAQDALLVSLARELKGTGVTANLLVVRAIDADHSGKAGWATPEELAAAILYLCSDEAAGINGARIPVTG